MIHVDRIARVHVQLDDIEPAIWRRIEVPLTTNLRGLHDVIQAAMPFENYHLFQFEVGDKCYGIPDPEWTDVLPTLDARNIRLGALVGRGVSQFTYTYDFGDDWRHTVTIETTDDADPALDYPRLLLAALRPRTLVVLRASRSSSTSSPNLAIVIASASSPGMEGRSIRRRWICPR